MVNMEQPKMKSKEMQTEPDKTNFIAELAAKKSALAEKV